MNIPLTATTVFLDLDSCLWKYIDRGFKTRPDIYQEEYGNTVPLSEWIDSDRYLYRLRPSTIPFLQALHSRRYNLMAMTSGGTEYQISVLKSLGIENYFGGLYGSEHYGESALPEYQQDFAQATHWVLVDDDNLEYGYASEKLFALALEPDDMSLPWTQMTAIYKQQRSEENLKRIADKHFVPCEEFTGFEDTHPLTDLLPLIDAKLTILTQEVQE